MALYLSSSALTGGTRIRIGCIITSLIVLMFASSPTMLGQTMTSGPIRQATLDFVNVGQDSPAGRLAGFGPPEPATHGGFWGGATGDFYRVVWFFG